MCPNTQNPIDLSIFQLLATPFSVLLLTLDPPVDYVMLLIYYFFCELNFNVNYFVPP